MDGYGMADAKNVSPPGWEKRMKKNDKRLSWDAYFLKMCRVVSERSTCDRGKAACILVDGTAKKVLSTGYAGSPAGKPHCDDVGHDMHNGHCIRTIHAEQNAVAQAAIMPMTCKGAIAYLTLSPCLGCAKLLVASQIIRVVCETRYWDGKIAEDYLNDCGVVLDFMELEND